MNWRELFRENETNSVDQLREEILTSNEFNLTQSLLIALNESIENMWNSLSLYDQHTFIRKYHRRFMNLRNPMPPASAKKMLLLFETGKLEICSGLQHLNYYQDETFYALFKNGLECEFDWIINATGASRFINSESRTSLIGSMLNNRLAKEHPMGGIEVEFDSLQVIGKTGQLNHHLYALGHLTSGTYYYTSSLEIISKQAKKIVGHMVGNLTKEPILL
ncbi:hypothetical protein [Thermoactinomyces sp. DSM 45892]|uniref:hypothetical protein n=1 Tax=Thermoactinomyces sp. DSM 45892 TaxID=1882753 RepID=UPI00159FDC03|nr:hypothetical protein [Thermoactinomyces sp. DSM 45892]